MITVGNFIDELKETNILEIIVFLRSWEQTAPIFHGDDYRSTPLAEDFVSYLFNEIITFTLFWLTEVKEKPRTLEMICLSMNAVLKMVSDMANKHVAINQVPQISWRS